MPSHCVSEEIMRTYRRYFGDHESQLSFHRNTRDINEQNEATIIDNLLLHESQDDVIINPMTVCFLGSNSQSSTSCLALTCLLENEPFLKLKLVLHSKYHSGGGGVHLWIIRGSALGGLKRRAFHSFKNV